MFNNIQIYEQRRNLDSFNREYNVTYSLLQLIVLLAVSGYYNSFWLFHNENKGIR